MGQASARSSHGWHAASIAAFALALGATSVVAQSIWIRELSLLWFGSELCWGMTLAAWLLGVAAGAASAGAITSRLRPAAVATACGLALAATLLAGLWLLRGAHAALAGGVGELIPAPSMLALTAAVAGTTGLWVGALFPAGCALAAAGRGDANLPAGLFGSTRRTIGVFFLLEALGTLIGGTCFTFWWVERFDAFSLAAGLSAALLLCLAAAIVRPGQSRQRRRRTGRVCGTLCAVAAGALIAACALGTAASADRASRQRRWEQLVGQVRHVAGRESPFGRIDLAGEAGEVTLYLNCQAAATLPNLSEVMPYVHLAASQSPRQRLRRALVIGQATGEVAEELRKVPGLAVEAVELDPRVHELLADHAGRPLAAPTHFGDGRHYLKAARGRYDLILLAVGDPTSIAAGRFYTREFFQLARDRLSDDGLLAFSLAGPAETISQQLRDYLGTVYRAAEGVFAETLWTWGEPVYVFASRRRGVLTSDPEELIRRYREHFAAPAGREGPPSNTAAASFEFDPLLFRSWRDDRLQPARLDRLRRALAATPSDRVNTDERPIAMFLATQRGEARLLSRHAGPAGAKRTSLLAALGRTRTHHALAAVGAAAALVCVTILLGRLRRRAAAPRLPILFSLATTGAAGIGLEIVLLAAFQNLYGYVYSHIALLVAIYMAGVAGGSLYYSRRAFPPGERAWRRLMLLDAGLCAGCAAVPGLLWLLRLLPASAAGLAVTEAIVLAMLCAAGAAGGLAVPLAAGLYRRGGAMPPAPGAASADTATGPVAGAVDASDCLGGAIGAVACGLVLLPLLGWTTACGILAALKLASLLALLLARAPRARAASLA